MCDADVCVAAATASPAAAAVGACVAESASRRSAPSTPSHEDSAAAEAAIAAPPPPTPGVLTAPHVAMSPSDVLAALAAAAAMPDGTAFALLPLGSEAACAAAGTSCKTVYFVRHAQGVHNEAYERAFDRAVYTDEAYADAHLTEKGRAQCRAVAPSLHGLPFEAAIVSPLTRTIETAAIALPAGVPTVALECARERCGLHPCDRRRPKSQLAAAFPRVDFSDVRSEEDEAWSATAREPWDALVSRADALCAALRARPERVLGVVSHSDFLHALLFSSRLHVAHEALRIRFANAQALGALLVWR